jgi:hypothetical protein
MNVVSGGGFGLAALSTVSSLIQPGRNGHLYNVLIIAFYDFYSFFATISCVKKTGLFPFYLGYRPFLTFGTGADDEKVDFESVESIISDG